jgi:hypothetical protein
LLLALHLEGVTGDTFEEKARTAPQPSPQRLRTVEQLRADAAAPRHPSDGAGRAWLETEGGAETPVAVAATRGRWTVVFEAGPEGVAPGGSVSFYVPTAWSWSRPQIVDPGEAGFVTVTAEPADLPFKVTANPRKMYIRVEPEGRAFAAGERLRFVYGAGSAGAMADRFAESRSRFWVGVDGNGDGVQKLLPDSPSVQVVAGPPALALLILPTTARPGETVPLTAALLDPFGNAGVRFNGSLHFEAPEGAGVSLPEALQFTETDGGVRTLEVTVQKPGIHRVRATLTSGGGALTVESNPLVVRPDAPRLLWGDFQGHSAYSDGTGTPEDFLRYARDVAALDAVALTDHDHWGRPFLDQRPAAWREIVEETARFHAPGRFITFVGYEWTSWIHGHRHVLFPAETGALLSNLDPRYEDPPRLWKALEGSGALTVAHHSAGGPIEVDWRFSPPPALEPVVEIASIHGSSEAPDSPKPIYKPVDGGWVRDALDRGYRLGFIGSGDSHDGHPGLSHIASPSGGLAALYTEERSREGVRAALTRRHCYATNGPRIYLHTDLLGHPMGSALAAAQLDPEAAGETPVGVLRIETVTPGAIDRIDIVQGGQVSASYPGEGARERIVEHPLEAPSSGEYLYVRVVQSDGGAAWASPYFFD